MGNIAPATVVAGPVVETAPDPERPAVPFGSSLAARADRITHLHRQPARAGRFVPWPAWVPDELRSRWAVAGIPAPWAHQVAAAEVVHAGGSVVLASGTASGKSLAYLMPALTTIRGGAADPRGSVERAAAAGTVLYLSPTKALAADQLVALNRLGLGTDWLRPALYDGDTPRGERDWIRRHANYLLTNPDMLHRTLLPEHARWARFLRTLRLVVVDECHTYRGVFGSHVAQVLRRVRRLAHLHGGAPQFVLTSATIADPAVTAARLTGVPMAAVTEDASPRAACTIALWAPPAAGTRGGKATGGRRTAITEAADLLADLVVAGAAVLAFVRSRRGAETLAVLTRERLAAISPGLASRVASYRGGYLPEERRALEARLRSGELRALATTNALELGIDIAGLDAVLLVGYPGSHASMWQQAGRAGRSGAEALAVLIARDDPLDTYLVHHPEELFGRPTEAAVLDPDNPYVLTPHLCAAAAESPLTEADLELFGAGAQTAIDDLTQGGLLRRRTTGWYWTRSDPGALPDDIRGCAGPEVRLVERRTGRLLGTVDAVAAAVSVHPGAVHLHQGLTYLVHSLDLDEHVALMDRADLDHTTSARRVSDVNVLEVSRTSQWAAARVEFGSVQVSTRVVSFLRKRLGTGEVIDETPLDLPARHLRTKAVWWVLAQSQATASGVGAVDLASAAHAAEHAAIGLLPLFAGCDRGDIGGTSSACHPDTGAVTVFVHDAHRGGAGFAERAYAVAPRWLGTTHDLVAGCACDAGCPSCVQSPTCGNGNRSLNKRGAAALLATLLAGAPKAH